MDTFMRNLANEPDEEGFMPAMKVYLLEKNEEEGVRPMVIICPEEDIPASWKTGRESGSPWHMRRPDSIRRWWIIRWPRGITGSP